LAAVYGHTFEEVEARYDELSSKIEEAELSPAKKENLFKLLEEKTEQAFINLRVFTGGTLTNSFAESINRRLRYFRLNYACPSRDVISILRNFCKYQIRPEQHRFIPNQIMKQVMSHDVFEMISHGVLTDQKEVLKEAISTCKVCSTTKEGPVTKFDIEDTDRFKVDSGWLVEQTTGWDVIWDEHEKRVQCACNAITYRGMPCKHIVRRSNT